MRPFSVLIKVIFEHEGQRTDFTFEHQGVVDVRVELFGVTFQALLVVVHFATMLAFQSEKQQQQ